MRPQFFDLGLIDYEPALFKQRELFQQVSTGKLEAALITCRHNPVITMGRNASFANLRISSDELKNKGIGLFQAERGGDITYHGPGQLIAYPIINLSYFKRDIHFFLRKLEDYIIRFLGNFGISGQARSGLTGVWAGEQKIASIGVAIRKWISFHGLAINIKADDLENFSLIRPCGMDISMTSLESVLGKSIDFPELIEGLKRSWSDD